MIFGRSRNLWSLRQRRLPFHTQNWTCRIATPLWLSVFPANPPPHNLYIHLDSEEPRNLLLIPEQEMWTSRDPHKQRFLQLINHQVMGHNSLEFCHPGYICERLAKTHHHITLRTPVHCPHFTPHPLSPPDRKTCNSLPQAMPSFKCILT